MFLSYALRPHMFVLGGLAVVAVLLLSAQPAAAQQYQRLPIGAKGYEIVQVTQKNLQIAQRTVTASRPGTPATYKTVQELEPVALPRVVTLIGPDGEARTFVLQGSIRTAQPRQVVVRRSK